MRAPWLPAVSASWDASAAQPGSSPGQAFRGHALDQGLVERCDDVLKDDVVAGAAVEHVDPATTDQHVIACITSQDVVAGTADQDVVAVAAVGGEQQVSRQSRRFDDIVAGERIDHDSVIGGIEAGDVHLRAQAHNGDPSVVTKDQDDTMSRQSTSTHWTAPPSTVRLMSAARLPVAENLSSPPFILTTRFS